MAVSFDGADRAPSRPSWGDAASVRFFILIDAEAGSFGHKQ
jgi:hypothetical protein